MISTVYMNRYPHYRGESGREAVTFDGTASLGELTALDTPLGRATDATLRQLGVDNLRGVPKSDMLLIGSQEQMFEPQRLRRLRQQIGDIARWAVEAEKSHYTSIRIVADTVDCVSESLRDSTPHELGFIGDTGELLRRFGEECNDDGCRVDFGRRPGWYSKASDRGKAFRALPDNLKEMINLTPDSEGRDTSEIYQESALRLLDVGWLIQHSQELGVDGFDEEWRGRFNSEQSLNRDAYQLVSNYIQEMTGRPLAQLRMAEDIIFGLIDRYKSYLQSEKDTAALIDQI